MTTKDFPKLESLNKANELGRSYNIDKITDKIYLGGIKGLLENEYLKTENINNILSLANSNQEINLDKNIRRKINLLNRIKLQLSFFISTIILEE